MKDINKFERTRKTIVFILDLLIYYLSFIVSFLVRYEFTIPAFNYRAYQSASIYIMIAFGLLNFLSGMYVLYNKRKLDMFYSTVINQFLMIIIITFLTFFGRWFAFPRTIIIISFVISVVFLTIWRVVVYNLYKNINGSEKVVVLGSELSCKRAIRNFEGARSDVYVITAAIVDNYFENLNSLLDDFDIVYITENVPNEISNEILRLGIVKDKQIFLSSVFHNLALLNADIMNIEDETFLKLTDLSIQPEYGIIKRTIDIFVSIFLLFLTTPILIITALLVKITSPGPLLYKQVRITKDQKEFNILKFRTMTATAEDSTGPVLAAANDARVTPLGKYLRSLRIDELPQLVNVLKGDMSLVGPRPERPFFVNQFQELNKHYNLRHTVRAGITGYAQVNGKYTTDFSSKLNFDLLYIKHYSVVLDIQILIQTIKTLFDKVSSQGIDEEEFSLETYKIPENIQVYD